MKGHFGVYGGQFVPETLMHPLEARPKNISTRWIEANGKLVDTIDRLSDELSKGIRDTSPPIMQMMKLNQIWIQKKSNQMQSHWQK